MYSIMSPFLKVHRVYEISGLVPEGPCRNIRCLKLKLNPDVLTVWRHCSWRWYIQWLNMSPCYIVHYACSTNETFHRDFLEILIRNSRRNVSSLLVVEGQSRPNGCMAIITITIACPQRATYSSIRSILCNTKNMYARKFIRYTVSM